MHAFVATVPITLLMAINYVVTYDIKDADVYITKSFANAEDYAKRLEKTNIFNHVYLEEDVLLTYPITVKKCFEMVRNGKKVVKDLKGRKYDYIYYNNSGWLINSIFYTGAIKGNPNCEQHFLEHGYSTYLTEYGKKPWYLRPLILLCGYKCMDGSMLKKLHMYNPDLLRVHQQGEVVKMPYMDRHNKRFMDAVNYVYGFDSNNKEFEDKEIYIMEQGPLKVDFDMEAFWSEIIEEIDTTKAIVKPHPRQRNSVLQKSGMAISQNNTVPWEVIALNSEMETKTQIAIFSGSCINPKNFCNIESRVIFLYKLLPIDYSFLGKDIVNLSEYIGKTYSDPKMFFVPESMDELREYLREYRLEKK